MVPLFGVGNKPNMSFFVPQENVIFDIVQAPSVLSCNFCGEQATKNKSLRMDKLNSNSTLVSPCVRKVKKPWRVMFEEANFPRLSNTFAVYILYNAFQASI